MCYWFIIIIYFMCYCFLLFVCKNDESNLSLMLTIYWCIRAGGFLLRVDLVTMQWLLCTRGIVDLYRVLLSADGASFSCIKWTNLLKKFYFVCSLAKCVFLFSGFCGTLVTPYLFSWTLTNIAFYNLLFYFIILFINS